MAEVILVDIFDNELGVEEKFEAHKSKKLHRAFSLFIVSGDKVLIQKRASGKYHSAGKWANACCSHPRPNMSIEESVIDRTKEELGIEIVNPIKLFDFIYYSEYNNGLTEYELDNVFLIKRHFDKFNLNKEEVEQVKWVNIDELSKSLITEPSKYSTWFLNCAPRVINMLKNNKC